MTQMHLENIPLMKMFHSSHQDGRFLTKKYTWDHANPILQSTEFGKEFPPQQ